MWFSRVLTRSWKAVSQSQQLFLTGCLSVCPFLGAKSPLRRESLRSSFQSKPIYRVPATAKSSTKTHSPGLCFLPWRILNSLHQWGKTAQGPVQLALEWNVTTFQSDAWSIHIRSTPSANLDINGNWERGHVSTGTILHFTVEILIVLFVCCGSYNNIWCWGKTAFISELSLGQNAVGNQLTLDFHPRFVSTISLEPVMNTLMKAHGRRDFSSHGSQEVKREKRSKSQNIPSRTQPISLH